MAKNKPNVIMILLDGSRVDKISASSELSKLVTKGSFFEQSIIASPYTVASVHSIFTGMYPSKHGVNSYNNMFGLSNDVKTLAEYMKEEGYYTEGDIMSKAVLSKRGFDKLDIHDEHSVKMLPRHTNIIKSVSESEVPFFLFLQYSKIHTDSITKIAKKFDDLDESFFTEEQRKINEVNFTKSMQDAGKYSINIMDNIKKLGLLDNTIVVFFSDHGTSLGEKYGEKMYGSFTYDYTIKTFALFINKICPSKKISTQVRSIDIAPTLLEMLDIEAVKGVNSMDGQSLMPLMAETERKSMFDFFKRKDKNRIAYVETGGLGGPWPSPNAPNVKCIRTPDSKIIYNLTPDTWEFYDLKNDPHENNNLIDKDTKKIRQMVKLLRQRL